MFSIGLKQVKDKLFWCFILSLSLFKLIICNSIPLSSDELHFCIYSKYLSLSYFDHPPLIAYLIKPFLIIFGNTNITPRICSSIVFCITAYILYCFIKKATNSITISQLTVVLIYSTPMINMLEYATDIPFMLFFCLSMYLFYYFIETKKDKYLYLCTLTTGLGLLSKYTMLCIYPSIILFLIISKTNRNLFKNKKIYLYFIISFLFFLPVIIWNMQFDNPSISFYNMDLFHFRLSVNETITNIDLLFQFLGSQIIYYNPFLCFLYKKILLNITIEYIPFLKIYGIINLLLIIWIYCHLFYLYFKTKQNIFIFIFSFSIIIWCSSMFWACFSFPVEYCAKISFILLCFYIAYIFQKKFILNVILLFYCAFGLYLSLLNPIYFLYGVDDLKANIEKQEIDQNPNFKDMILTIKKYQNEIDFVACTGKSLIPYSLNKISYYLNDMNGRKFKFVWLFQKDYMYSYWKQNLNLLKDKNCILFITDNCKDLISQIKTKDIFDSIEEISKNIYICKKFNFEKYKMYYSDCHYELKNIF